MSQARQRILFLVLLVGVSLLGALLLAYVTPHGMGLVNDSVGYIAGARNLVLGDGYSRLTGNGEPRPITNYPPLYSFFLALPILLGIDSLAAARWLNLILFAIGAILAGLIIYRVSKSKTFGVIAALLFISSKPFFQAYTFALSELQFLFSFMCWQFII